MCSTDKDYGPGYVLREEIKPDTLILYQNLMSLRGDVGIAFDWMSQLIATSDSDLVQIREKVDEELGAFVITTLAKLEAFLDSGASLRPEDTDAVRRHVAGIIAKLPPH